jgi:hypothetical protein
MATFLQPTEGEDTLVGCIKFESGALPHLTARCALTTTGSRSKCLERMRRLYKKPISEEAWVCRQCDRPRESAYWFTSLSVPFLSELIATPDSRCQTKLRLVKGGDSLKTRLCQGDALAAADPVAGKAVRPAVELQVLQSWPTIRRDDAGHRRWYRYKEWPQLRYRALIRLMTRVRSGVIVR